MKNQIVLIVGLFFVGIVIWNLQDHKPTHEKGIIIEPATEYYSEDPEVVALSFAQSITQNSQHLQHATILDSFNITQSEVIVLGTGQDLKARPRLFIVSLAQNNNKQWDVITGANLCVTESPYAVSYMVTNQPILIGIHIPQTTTVDIEGFLVKLPSSEQDITIINVPKVPENATIFPIGQMAEQEYQACSHSE